MYVSRSCLFTKQGANPTKNFKAYQIAFYGANPIQHLKAYQI